MFMTGHRNEASVRSYSRGTTEEQMFKMSRILTDVSTGGHNHKHSKFSQTPAAQMPKLLPSKSNQPQPAFSNKSPETRDLQLRAGTFNPASCTFANCTFTINSN